MPWSTFSLSGADHCPYTSPSQFSSIKSNLKTIGGETFRFGFPKGLLYLIVKPNLDAWQFAGRVNVM
jgi:hypothetical protein